MKDTADTQAIKCKKCGAPSYFDQKAEGFLCPFCKDFAPWASADYRYTLDMVFRHRPIPIIDGLLKLTHVGLGEETAKDPRPPEELKQRTRDTEELLYELDKGTLDKWKEREEVSFKCSFCDGTVSGFSTQNVFICEYCGNKTMAADVFETGSYGEDLAFGYDPNMYNRVLPLKIKRDEAKQLMRRLVSQYRDDFMGQDIEKRIEEELQVFYLPYWVEDISLKATVNSERGKFTFYHDRINWARPQFSQLDIYLLNELNPWDYGESAPFTPGFLEDDARIFAPQNTEDRVTAMRRMLWRDIPGMLESAFGLKKVKLISWLTDFRRHKYASINLPVWYLDKPGSAGENDLQIRMAVNGQTGKAAALFLEAGKKDYTRVLEASTQPKMSDESTIYSPPLPIKYEKKPFLYQVLDANKVLRKLKVPFF